MNKKRFIKNILFILIIAVVCMVIFFASYYFSEKENPILQLIENIIDNEKKITENYNGIYTYKYDLNGTKYIYPNCSISNINYNILIINDKYYSYKSSCMGTYYLNEGKTSDLDIKNNEDNNSFEINFEDKIYVKDYTVNSIVLNNDIEKKLTTIDLTNYQLILNETEFSGNYYDIKAKIKGISSNMRFNFKILENGTYKIEIGPNYNNSTPYYEYSFRDFNNLPLFYPYGKNVVVLEQNMNENDSTKFAHKFKTVNPDGIVYNIDNIFPITVDNIILNTNNSIYITFDQNTRYFKMLVGFDDKMCVENSTSDNITYYEFKIDYNYKTNNFSQPEFIKIGHEKEGCNYINRIMGRGI